MFDMIPFNNNGLAKDGDNSFSNLVSSLFNSFFNGEFLDPSAFMGNSFKADVRETSDNYIIEADLPGVSREAILVEYESNYVTITVKREDIMEDNRYEEPRRARFYGEVRRSFFFPDIDDDNIHANLRHGRLTVILPKLDNHYKRRKRINIR
jgi:HSP20 family protein